MLYCKEQSICFYLKLGDTSNPGSPFHFMDLDYWKLSCSLWEGLSISEIPFFVQPALQCQLHIFRLSKYTSLPLFLQPWTPVLLVLCIRSTTYLLRSFQLPQRKKALQAVPISLSLYPPLNIDPFNLYYLFRSLLPLSR